MVFNVGRLSVSDSGSNDHTTKFWCRNRPGETLRDNRQSNAHAQGKFNAKKLLPILRYNEQAFVLVSISYRTVSLLITWDFFEV